MDDKLLYKMQSDIGLLKDAVQSQAMVNRQVLATIENIANKDIKFLEGRDISARERLSRIEEAVAKLLDWHRAYDAGLTDKVFSPLIRAFLEVVNGTRESSGAVRARSEISASSPVQSPASKRDA